MNAPASRRGFLRDLVGLPLIGGGLTLIGAPSAVAEPCTPMLLNRYVGFLAREYAHAHDELLAIAMVHPVDDLTWKRPIADLHFATRPANLAADALMRAAPPSTRAALVLSTVGCGWEGRRL